MHDLRSDLAAVCDLLAAVETSMPPLADAARCLRSMTPAAHVPPKARCGAVDLSNPVPTRSHLRMQPFLDDEMNIAVGWLGFERVHRGFRSPC